MSNGTERVTEADNYLAAGTTLRSWLTTHDHKRIALLYMISITAFFFIGGAAAVLMRFELATPAGDLVSHDTYNKLFTMHGVIMVWMFLIPSIPAGLGNFLMPMMIGARDLAFPRLNLLSWYLYVGGGLFTVVALIAGGADTGWTFYAPFSTLFSNTHVIFVLFGVFVVGFSSILTGINFIVTVHMLRAPGLTWFRLPLFIWSMYATSLIIVLGTPVVAITVLLLAAERLFHVGIFDPAIGGDPILFQHLFWFYSHPAVYIMVLPAMGMISEILPVFSRKPLFGYKAFVFATAGIGALGFSVWAHHMFTTGSVYLPFFSLMTFLIAVPTGVKMFNWIFTLFRGKLTFSTPLLFALGFLSMFLIGGINGAFSAAVPVDFALHDTYWVVAHLHYVLFGGSVFGVMAGLYYWFPKMTGRMLSEGLGKIQFVLMFVGFNLTFFPMHQLGLAGMPRRIADYASNAGWNDLNLAATIGGFMIAASMIPLLWNIFSSLRGGKIAGDDPWEANTLEWATSSPPPPYNFDHLPEIRSERPLFDLRHGRTVSH